MKTPYTSEKLIHDFTDLGIEKGDTLFIHSSFKNLGPIEDGAGTVISALEAVIGQDGLILMPSFNLRPSQGRTRCVVGRCDNPFNSRMVNGILSGRCRVLIAPITTPTLLLRAGKTQRRLSQIISDVKATNRHGTITRGAKLTARIHRCFVPTSRMPNFS